MKQSKLDRILAWVAWAIIITWTLAIIVVDVSANVNQTTTSGSNTNISGDYSSTSTTSNDYSAAQSVDNSTTSNSTSNVRSSPSPSSAPPLSNGIDTCSITMSAGVSTFNFGVSTGLTQKDELCEARKMSKLLHDQGMKIAALSRLCTADPWVWHSMFQAGTYCPINIGGKSLIGDAALRVYTAMPELRGDYEIWKEQQKIVEKYRSEQNMYTSGR